jgi:hypothetical protein
MVTKNKEEILRIIGTLEGIAVFAESDAVADMLFDIAHKLETIVTSTEE